MDKYMISYVLLISGGILLLVVIFNMVIKYVKYRGVISEEVSGYDICKKLIDKKKIADVNIIETRDGSQNIYNIHRRVIRLSFRNYYNRDCYSLGVCSFLAGYCMLDDDKFSYIKNTSKIFSKISFISISSVIAMVVSYLFKGYYALVGFILLIVLFIYQYFRKCISNECIKVVCSEVSDIGELDSKMKMGIQDVVRGIDFSYNVGLVITVLQICRLFIYMMM